MNRISELERTVPATKWLCSAYGIENADSSGVTPLPHQYHAQADQEAEVEGLWYVVLIDLNFGVELTVVGVGFFVPVTGKDGKLRPPRTPPQV